MTWQGIRRNAGTDNAFGHAVFQSNSALGVLDSFDPAADAPLPTSATNFIPFMFMFDDTADKLNVWMAFERGVKSMVCDRGAVAIATSEWDPGRYTSGGITPTDAPITWVDWDAGVSPLGAAGTGAVAFIAYDNLRSTGDLSAVADQTRKWLHKLYCGQ